MTDEMQKPTFKAPPLPNKKVQIPSHSPQVKTPFVVEQKQIEGEKDTSVDNKASQPTDDLYANNFAADLKLPPKVLQTKVMGSILAAIFLFGMMMGCAMFGGGSKTVVQGLTDVVLNPDIPAYVRRCGQTDPNRECVLYIMNNKTFDRLGSDFFQEAQNMTDVQKYAIQLRNVRYANALIRPGYIAQIYIPARY